MASGIESENYMKKNKKISPFKYYYKELISHRGVTSQNKKAAKKFLLLTSIIDIILLILCFLLIVYRYSKVVCYFTNGSKTLLCVYAIMLIYAFFASTSYTIYHIVSYNYECKNKHELNKEDIKGVYKLYFFIFKFIHLPWILLSCLIQKILELFKIQSLKEYLPMLICGYLYFLIFALFIFQILYKFTNTLLSHYTFLTNTLITKNTYLYIIVFISIIISKHIPTLLLKISLRPFIDKNSNNYKEIFDRYHLLNYYFLVLITLILKALNFSDENKILVDALFYTTNAMTLFSTARQKAKKTQT